MNRLIHKLKKLQRPFERVLFPILLVLWPFVTVNQGICITDTAYALGNYTFLSAGKGSTWFYATLTANETGKLLSHLPGGNTALGMNLYTGALVAVLTLTAYYVLGRMIPGWMCFAGEVIAESLCWCPTVILYNYLTYFFLTLAVLFLFLAVNRNVYRIGRTDRNREGIFYVLSGLCLGAGVTVRLSNLPQALLILAVWFWSVVTRRSFRGTVKRTLLCVAGWLAGFLAGIGTAALEPGAGVRYGRAVREYFAMIPALLGMTGSASDYTAGGMFTSILSAYGHSLRWFLILVMCTVFGVIVAETAAMKEHRRLFTVSYLLGLLILVRFYYSRGMFTVNYHDYWSMFEWGMQFVLLALLFSVLAMGGFFLSSDDERFLGAAVLILILVLPVGSNNYTFPLLNCLFVIAPFTLWMLRRAAVYARSSFDIAHITWKLSALAIVVMLFAQGVLFHASFAFGDGTDGTERSSSVGKIPYLAGMKTTPENAAQLDALADFLADAGVTAGAASGDGSDGAEDAGGGTAAAGGEDTGRSLLAFGDAPGLNIYFDLPPALSTTWPDLDSYPAADFEAELTALLETAGYADTSGAQDDVAGSAATDLPVVIVHSWETAWSSGEEKREALKRFLADGQYESVYNADGCEVFLPR